MADYYYEKGGYYNTNAASIGQGKSSHRIVIAPHRLHGGIPHSAASSARRQGFLRAVIGRVRMGCTGTLFSMLGLVAVLTMMMMTYGRPMSQHLARVAPGWNDLQESLANWKASSAQFYADEKTRWTSHRKPEAARPLPEEETSRAYGRYVNFYHRLSLPSHLENDNAAPGEMSENKERPRVWLIGDIHGMLEPLKEVKEKMKYRQDRDVCVIVGDLVTKGPQSLDVVTWSRNSGCLTVRGNHEDKLIKWREWFAAEQGRHAMSVEEEPQGELAAPSELGSWSSEHRKLAQKMNHEDYEWLVRSPVILHLPEYDTYVIHAGILPANFHTTASNLAMAPSPSGDVEDIESESFATDMISSRKMLAANATLLSAPGYVLTSPNLDTTSTESLIIVNSDPYILMNMRSIRHGWPTRKAKKGTPWAHVWEAAMDDCADANEQFDGDWSIPKSGRRVMGGCRPVKAVYGHAAARGLETRRWSIGLDSGCVYGGHLTAFALPRPSKPGQSASMGFGERGSVARREMIQVGCQQAAKFV